MFPGLYFFGKEVFFLLFLAFSGRGLYDVE